MSDRRTTSTNWVNVPDRTLAYTVKSAGTGLEVVVADNFGTKGSAHTNGCGWRILMNGAVINKEVRWHTSTRTGWRITPTQIRAYVPASKLSKGGTYTFQVQWVRYSGASECLIGWPDGSAQNSMTVTEILEDTKRSLVTFGPRDAWPDTRPASTSWTNVAGRVMSVAKQHPDSILRITYHDTLGYHQTGSHTTACRQRVLINGGTRGTREQHSHSAATGGWRIVGRVVSAQASGMGCHVFLSLCFVSRVACSEYHGMH